MSPFFSQNAPRVIVFRRTQVQSSSLRASGIRTSPAGGEDTHMIMFVFHDMSHEILLCRREKREKSASERETAPDPPPLLCHRNTPLKRQAFVSSSSFSSQTRSTCRRRAAVTSAARARRPLASPGGVRRNVLGMMFGRGRPAPQLSEEELASMDESREEVGSRAMWLCVCSTAGVNFLVLHPAAIQQASSSSSSAEHS